MNLREKWDLQRQYRLDLGEQVGNVRREVSSLEGWAEEKLRWLERVDEAVDDIAAAFGVEVPYVIDSEYGRKNDVRYNPAYRLEMLKEKLAGLGENRETGEE